MTASSRPISTSTLTSACACYNSGLFDFRKDTVTPSLKIDDKLLSDILSELYPPKSPYEFSVIGIEILGEVYEQFLGKVIRLTDGHQAKVEKRFKGLVPTRALDGSSGPRKLSAMPSEPRPPLTEVESYVPELRVIDRTWN